MNIFEDFANNAILNFYYDRISRLLRFDENLQKKWIYNRLKKLLETASKYSPFYRELFDSIGFDPRNSFSYESFAKLPILTKDIIRKNKNEILNSKIPRMLIQKKSTGGTSGQPLHFFIPRVIGNKIEKAFILAIWKDFGFEKNMRVVSMRGNIVGNEKSPYFYDKKNNVLLLSSYLLSQNNINVYCDLLNEFDPEFIHTYPSVALNFISLIENKNKLKLKSLKGVICASENLQIWQRDKIEKFFKVNCYAHYGCSEGAVLAKYLREYDAYEMIPYYSFVELVDKDGNPIKEKNKEGFIVGTNLWNFVYPFIRYKVGDIAEYRRVEINGKERLLLANLFGREQEYLIDKNGRKIQLTGNYLINNNIAGIEQIQLEQNKPGEIIVKILKNGNFTSSDYRKIIEGFDKRYGDKITPKIIFTNNFVRSPNGKHKYLIQNIKGEQVERLFEN